MAFIAHVSVVWLLVNSALFLACAQALGLNRAMRCVVMLGFALSPLVQLLHATGMIDHHFMELTFTLLTVWLGLRWLRSNDDRLAAGLLGAALGLAPAFHNGLFILQLPVLACVFVLWLRHAEIPLRSLKVLAGSLVAATALIVLPSAPFREGMFEFSLLSWFHLYVAICSAVVLVVIGARRFSSKNLGILAGVAVLLAIPVIAQALRGAMFLSGDIYLLDAVLEVHSPYKMFTQTMSPTETASLYSWLIVAAPLLFVWFAWRTIAESDPKKLYYAIWSVFGLGLMLSQYRFNYFGLFFLISGPVWLLQSAAEQRSWRPSASLLAAMIGLLVLYQPALRERLFIVYASGGDTVYADGLPAYHHLAELCAEKPGRVLANNNDGNAILYHTECSVIVNNFIMRPEDETNHAVVDMLMRSTPDDIRRYRPQIDYVFLRADDFSTMVNGEMTVDARSPIANQLLLRDEPPEGFEISNTMYQMAGQPPAPKLFGRILKVTPLYAVE
jgi:hypothetical protein